MDKSAGTRHTLTACILFIISFALRLLLISKGPYSVDTLNLALKAEQLVTTLQLSYSYGSGYPLTIICGGLFVALGKLAGINDPVLAVNFMSVVLGAACVPLLYAVTRRMIDPVTAVFAAVFFSTAPIILAVSTYGLSHTPALFFLLAGVLYLLRYRDEGAGRDFVISAVAIGFLGAARLQNLVLMTVPLAYLLWSATPARQRVQIFIRYGLTAAVAMAAFYLPYVLGSGREAYISQWVSYREASVIPHVSPGLLFKPLLNVLYHIIHTFTPVGIVMIVVGGWILLKQERSKGGIFLFLWMICPVLLYSRLYTLVPRFLTVLHPPLCIFMAFFCATLFQKGRLAQWLTILLAFVMSIGMVSIVYPVLKVRHEYAYIPEYVRWVVRKVPDNARIVTVDDSLFFRYYSNLELLSRFHNQYKDNLQAHAEFRRELDLLLAADIPVYVTEHGLYNYDPNGSFAKLLTEEYRLQTVGAGMYEFWQESCWQPGRYPRKLYRIWPKSQAG